MRFIIILSLVVVIISGCKKQKEFEIQELTIVTKDAKTLAAWYVKNLGFETSKDVDLLYHENLTIRLEENEDAKNIDTLRKHLNVRQVPGIFKFGFITNQFDNLTETLENNGVKFHDSILYDSLLDMRMLVIKDPEGNRVQLFETTQPYKLKPHFIALIVEMIGEQETWYQVNLPIAETHSKDLDEREVYIRLLESKEVVIELIQVEKQKVRSELDYTDIMGFYQIKVRGAKVPFESDHEGNKIIHLTDKP